MLNPNAYQVPLRYSADIYPERVQTGRSTWTDWKLIPTSRLSVNPPEPKYNFIDVPGTSREIDLTDAVAGHVNYGPRTGSWEFVIVDPDVVWYELYSEIMEFIQGKRCRVVLRPDMDYYYEGRLYVNEFKSNPDNSTIVIDYHFGPFKYDYNDDLDQLENWITQLNYIDNQQTQAEFELEAGGASHTLDVDVFAPTVPRFVISGGPVQLLVSSDNWKGVGTYTIPTGGDYTNENIVMMNGPGSLTFYVESGDANASVEVRFANGHL